MAGFQLIIIGRIWVITEDPLTLSQYVELAGHHKAIALRYTDSLKGSIRTVAYSVHDGLTETLTIMADPAGAAEGRKHYEDHRRHVEKEMAKLPKPRIRLRVENDGRRFERVVKPGYQFHGQQYPSEPSEFEVCLQVGKEITIRKDGDDREQTFAISDQAEYDYYNRYGESLDITAKTVLIAKDDERKSRKSLYNFSHHNFGFDQRKAYSRNADDSYYR